MYEKKDDDLEKKTAPLTPSYPSSSTSDWKKEGEEKKERKKWWKYGYYGYGYGYENYCDDAYYYRPPSYQPTSYPSSSPSHTTVRGFGGDAGYSSSHPSSRSTPYWDDYAYYGGSTYRPSRYKSSTGWNDVWSYSYSTKKTSSEDISKKEQLLKTAYRNVYDMVLVLSFPFQVYISITNNPSPSWKKTANGSRRLFVPTYMIDKKDLTDGDKIKIFCGLGLHEASHLKFSQYGIYERWVRDVSNEVSDSRVSFVLSLFDFLEDERVEDLLLRDRPGYLSFIERSKQWSLEQLTDSIKDLMTAEDSKTEDKDHELRLEVYSYLINLFKLIRFPDGLEDSVVEKYSESYEKIRDIIFPLPDSTKGACIAAMKVYKEILSTFPDLPKFLPSYNVDGTRDDIFQIFSSAVSKGHIKLLYGNDKDSGAVPAGELLDDAVKSCEKLLDGLLSGEIERGGGKATYFSNPEPTDDEDKASYKHSESLVKAYVPAIRKAIKGVDKNYDFCIYGCRSGLLDTNKLAEAYQGVPQVYVRKGMVKTNKTTVCVLVDESGSMYYDKSEIARQATILLYEALGNLPGVDLYIYGHTADLSSYGSGDSTTIYRYIDGSKKGKNNKYSLAQITARYENRDGVAILETAKDIRKKTQDHCIMIVISDGSPSAQNYRGYEAIADTCAKVKQVEAMDFDVIQVMIEQFSSSKEMFTNVIDLTSDLSRFPARLGKLIKKFIVSDKKTEVS